MSSSSSSSSTSADARGVVAATVVAAALRLPRLGAEPLWLDEATTASFAARAWRGALFAEPNHPPLFTLLEHAVTRLGLGGDAGLRLLPAACGIALVPATAALARRLDLGRPRVVAWLVATSPLAIFFAREARAYALLMLLVVLATTAFLRVVSSGRGLAAYAMLAVLAMHTHYLAGAALAAHEVAYWRGPRPEGLTRRWLAARAAVALACAPWFAWVVSHVGAQARPWLGSPLLRLPYAALRFVVGYGALPVDRRLLDGGARAIALDALPWVPALLGLLGAWLVGAIELGRRAPTPERRVLGLLLVLPWLLVLALAPAVNLVSERYLSWQVPLGAILVALAIARARRPGRALAVLVALQLACALPVVVGARRVGPLTLRYGKEQWRDAAAIVDAAAPDAVLCAPGYLALALDRYRAPGGPPVTPVAEGVPTPPPLPGGRVALVVSRGGPAEDALAARLAAAGTVRVDVTLPAQLGIRVLVVEGAKAP